MWWVFDRILPVGHVIGGLLAIPAGFLEAIVVLGLIARAENFLKRDGESVRIDMDRSH
jgi:hypothetical protein